MAEDDKLNLGQFMQTYVLNPGVCPLPAVQDTNPVLSPTQPNLSEEASGDQTGDTAQSLSPSPLLKCEAQDEDYVPPAHVKVPTTRRPPRHERGEADDPIVDMAKTVREGKAYIGSNARYAMEIRDPQSLARHIKERKWLLKHFDYQPNSEAQSRVSAEEVKRVMNMKFPQHATHLVTRIMKLAFPACRKVNLKQGHFFLGLRRKDNVDYREIPENRPRKKRGRKSKAVKLAELLRKGRHMEVEDLTAQPAESTISRGEPGRVVSVPSTSHQRPLPDGAVSPPPVFALGVPSGSLVIPETYPTSTMVRFMSPGQGLDSTAGYVSVLAADGVTTLQPEMVVRQAAFLSPTGSTRGPLSMADVHESRDEPGGATASSKGAQPQQDNTAVGGRGDSQQVDVKVEPIDTGYERHQVPVSMREDTGLEAKFGVNTAPTMLPVVSASEMQSLPPPTHIYCDSCAERMTVIESYKAEVALLKEIICRKDEQIVHLRQLLDQKKQDMSVYINRVVECSLPVNNIAADFIHLASRIFDATQKLRGAINQPVFGMTHPNVSPR